MMKKRTRNLLGTLFLALALVAAELPVTDVEATSAAQSDFQMDGSKLVKYTGTATTVSVPEYVTEIGRDAFNGDNDLHTVYLKKNVETIGANAFSGCSMLTVIDIPDSLKEIGDFAFYNCASLADVTLGKNVNKIGKGAFAGDTSLEKIKIHKDNASYVCDTGVLYNKDKTKVCQALAGSIFNKYNMPNSVKEVAEYAFWGCPDIRFVAFSSFIETIPPYAFSNCKGLESFTLPYSVKSIDMKAFADCPNLQKAEIPESVNYIHATAFDGCPQLKIIAAADSAAAKFDAARDKSIVGAAEYEDTAGVPSSVQSAGGTSGTALNDATQAPGETVTQPSNGTLGETMVVGGQAVVFIDNKSTGVLGTAAKEPAQTQAPQTPVKTDLSDMVSGETNEETSGAVSDNAAAPESYDSAESGKGGQFPKYTVVGNKIAGQAYYKDTDLNTYAIPAGIEEIGNFSFARSGLEQIIIPEGVKKIGYGAFYHCDALGSVTIPSSVTEIEPYAFEKTKWLENWKSGGSTDNYYIVGDGILIAYKGKESKLTIPEGVKQIAAEVFANHKGITEVALPNSLQVIGEDTFAGCNNLKTVTGGVNVEKIQDRAFAGCPIETVRIHEKVKEVGLKAFDGAENAVVFLGKQLPVLTYEDTSSRLSRKNYRKPTFEKAKVAVIDAAITDVSGTVLDAALCGFRGLICNIEKEAVGNESGSLHIVSNTLQSEMPKSVTIYGKLYTFSNAEEKKDSEAAAAAAGGKPISVRVNSTKLTNAELITTASIPGHTEKGVLTIQDSEGAKEEILKGYQILYGADSTQEIAGFDISYYDESGTVPITKLGSESMTITMPVPSGIAASNLHVVCTDADGQLEEAASRLIEINRVPCVEFQAKHFSAYGIYSYGDGQKAAYAQNGGTLTAITRRKDASPDTGDMIHPKWFLAMGMFALAMMMFFMRKPKISK